MRTGDRMKRRRFRALLLTALLSVCLYAPAGTAEEARDDVALVLAQNAVENLGLKDAAGEPLVPREAPEMNGRGIPDETGLEPDYRGVVGYVSLQADWEVSRFNTFTETPWILPVYEQDGEEWKIAGQIPYWTLALPEAVRYGFCIAVYNERSRSFAIDRKGHRGPLPEGIRVLMCDKRSSRYISPDKEHNPLLGIIFRNQEDTRSYFRTFLFFGEEDLTLVY